jgi:hypothetical protein
MKDFLHIINLIYEFYKFIIVAIVTVYLFLFLIVGGHFKVEIYWDNIRKLF